MSIDIDIIKVCVKNEYCLLKVCGEVMISVCIFGGILFVYLLMVVCDIVEIWGNG